MGDKGTLTPREALEREKARVLEQAAAEAAAIDRQLAAIERLEREAAKYGLVLAAAGAKPAPQIIPKTEATLESQNNERQTSNRSVAALIASYRSDEASPYQALRHATRQSYESRLRVIEADLGGMIIGDLKASDLSLVYEAWTKRGAVMAHGLMGMLRALVNYGGIFLKDRECDQLSLVLRRMRFEVSKPSNSKRLVEKDALAIINEAHKRSLHSLAFAQAFQTGCGLPQRDVIGEWVPEKEPGFSYVEHHDGMKWLRGIRWDEIDENLILRHTTSKKLKDIEVNLRKVPMVMAEFARLGARQQSGPVIVSEATNRPYTAWAFRSLWREVARAAGVSDLIKNMDSRASTKRVNGHAEPGEFEIPPGSLSP